MSQLPSLGLPDARDPGGTPCLTSPSGEAPQALPLQFRGTARDYFGAWVVNILLALCTLGGWAKVRTMRWFHGHTCLAGVGFDYHATGGQILKGR